MASKDLELVVRALQEAFAVIDDHDPDRNPARCMRQLRRLFDNISVRAAIRRLAAELPLPPDPRDAERSWSRSFSIRIRVLSAAMCKSTRLARGVLSSRGLRVVE